MNVRFYFDPICPWCWITSRWLVQEVVPVRDVTIDWRPISLLVRNEERLGPDEVERRARYTTTHGLLRVVDALREDGNADLVSGLYTEFGRRIHHERRLDFDLGEALGAAGVDAAYAEAATDSSYDGAVRAFTEEAEALAGDDVGTPIVAYEVDGDWKGYFGPVIPAVVRGDAALRLWDGLALLIETDGFYEIKKTRTLGPQMDSANR